ncbi:MAG TPA: rod-binding protein [Novosphingobium sp.]|nr:rod-binding protein [Novosphingobium sp.]
MSQAPALSATFATATASAAPASSDREKLAAAARQFEAIFLREMLSAARKTDFGGGAIGGGGLDTFRQMQDEHFADVAAKTGTIGMAEIIEAQLARFIPAQTGAQMTGGGK